MAQYPPVAKTLAALLLPCLLFLEIYFGLSDWQRFSSHTLLVAFFLSVAALAAIEWRCLNFSNFVPQLAIIVLYVCVTGYLLAKCLGKDGLDYFFVSASAIWLAPIIAHSFLIAVTEEIMFRRYLLDALCQNWSKLFGICFSSLVFFTLHLTLSLTVLLSGFVYGFLVQKYRSLLGVVGLHFAFDALLFTARHFKQSEVVFDSGTSAYVAIGGSGVLGLLVTFMFLTLWFGAARLAKLLRN